jgi:branched-subunit amino acid aminotransferase/4-amino-4-deoxychorismate lyase
MKELDGNSIEVDQLAILALAPYGHFTTMRVTEKKVRGMTLHLERLERDCRSLFDVDLDLDHVRTYVRRALVDKAGPLIVRVTIFDPSMDLANPAAPAHPAILVTTRPTGSQPTPPMRVQSARYAREDPEVKHVNLYGAIRLRRTAQRNGFDDALFCDDDGYLLEGTLWNIGFFDGKNVIWPLAAALDGVTSSLLENAHHGTVVRRPVHYNELPNMLAVFATNGAIGVTPISAIDSLEFAADHMIIAKLQHEYDTVIPEAI